MCSNRPAFQSAGGVAILNAAKKNHSNNSTVQEKADQLLAKLK